MHAAWKKASFERSKKILLIALAAAAIAGVAVPLMTFGWRSVLSVMGIVVALWIVFASLIEPIERLRKKQSLSAGVLGMSIAHLGLGLFIIGATTVESFKEEADLSLRPGQSTEHAGFVFTMNSLREVQGPNYTAIESEIRITRDGEEVAVVHPQKRVYRVQTMPMTEAGIDGRWNRDLFVAMGDHLGDGAWSLRLQYKPLVRFIWFGAFVAALGGLISACDRRYRQRVPATASAGLASAADAKSA
jgi:cytochrome c-type biogenesis protein CcmF